MSDSPGLWTLNPTVRRSLLKYCVFRILSDAGFATPFFVVFMVSNGVTYTDIALGTSVMSAVVISLELPSGYFADRFGRRRTMFLSQVSLGLGTIGYVVAGSTLDVILLYIAFGVGAALRSGAGSAWFYDKLSEYGEEEKYTAVRGKLLSYVKYVEAVTMVGGGLLFIVEPVYAIAAGAVANSLAAPVLLTLPKNEHVDDDDSGVSPREAVGLTWDFLTNPAVRTVLIITVLGAGAMFTASKYIQPVAFDAIPDSGYDLAGVGIPAAILVAVTYAIFQFSSGFVVSHSADAESRLGVGGAIAVAYGGSAVCMILPWFFPTITLPAVILMMSLPMLAGPSVQGYLNGKITSVARATINSSKSFLNALLRIPIMLASGVVADVISPFVAMAVVGSCFLAVSSLTVLIDRPVTIAEDTSTGSAGD